MVRQATRLANSRKVANKLHKKAHKTPHYSNARPRSSDGVVSANEKAKPSPARTIKVAQKKKKKKPAKAGVVARRRMRKLVKKDHSFLGLFAVRHAMSLADAAMKGAFPKSRHAVELMRDCTEDIITRILCEANELTRISGTKTVQPKHVLFSFHKWCQDRPGMFEAAFRDVCLARSEVGCVPSWMLKEFDNIQNAYGRRVYIGKMAPPSFDTAVATSDNENRDKE